MPSPSLIGAVLDVVSLASTVTVVVWLVSGLQPLFERARNSCRALQPPEGRELLLWSALLIPIVWVAAAALYFRMLFSLWNFMGAWLEDLPGHRIVYAVLHLYLFFFLLGGTFALAVTVFELARNRHVFSDLVMIARFSRRRQASEDTEGQHGSSSSNPVHAEAETASTVGNSKASCSSDQHLLDSDGDRVTVTPSSSSSSSSNDSDIEELEYVDDDIYRNGPRSDRLGEPLEDRKRRDMSYIIGPRHCVNGEGDSDPYSLYNATPRLRPQNQNAKTDVEPLDIGEPLSPCGSCSSAYVEEIPSTRRSLARVPITPTSPTADAEDADTEKTDVERKKRDRKHRNSAVCAPKAPRADMPRYIPPFPSSETDPNLGDCEDSTRAPNSNLAAQAPEQRACVTISARAPVKFKPKTSPIPAPASHPRAALPRPDRASCEAEVLRSFREAADNGGSAIPGGDENAHMVSFNGKMMLDLQTSIARRIAPAPAVAVRLPSRKRAGSPYPWKTGGTEGGKEKRKGKGPRGLSIDIPGLRTDSAGGEGKGC